MISSDVPFVINQTIGTVNFLAMAVERAFNIYRADDLTLALCSPQLNKKIQYLTVWHDLTFCVCIASKEIVVYKRTEFLKILNGKHQTNIMQLYIFGNYLISISKDNTIVMWSLIRSNGYNVEYYDQFNLIRNNRFLQDDVNNSNFDNNKELLNVTSILHPNTYLNKILIASDDGHLDLWNVRSKKCIYRFTQFINKEITTVVQSPAIDVVGIGCRNGRIFIHNLKYDEILMKFVHGDGGITSLAFRNDTFRVNSNGTNSKNNTTSILAAGSTSGSISIWNLETRSLHSEIKQQHTDAIVKLEFLNNEPLLLSSSIDNSLKMFIFDKPDGTCRLLKSRTGHSNPPTMVRFYGDNLDENNGKAVDGSALQILSGGQDCSFRSFHATRDSQSRELSQGPLESISNRHSKKISDLKLPPIVDFDCCELRNSDWANIISCHEKTSSAYTWSFKKKTLESLVLQPGGGNGSSTSGHVEFGISKKAKRKRGTFARANLDSRDGYNDRIVSVALTVCGNYGLVGTVIGYIYRFSMQSGLQRGRYPSVHENDLKHDAPITSINTSNANKYLISTSLDKTIKLWDFKTIKLIETVKVQSPIVNSYLHRESGLLACSCDDYSVLIYDIFNIRRVRYFQGHTRPITDMTISPDGRWLITSSVDLSLRVWDIPSGTCINWYVFGKAVTSLSLSKTGEFLATTHVDEVGIFLWANRGKFENLLLNGNVDEPVRMGLPTSKPGLSTNDDDDDGNNGTDKDTNNTSRPVINNNGLMDDTPLANSLATLSSIPRSRWETLSKLDLIKDRNKPVEAPKAPEQAPFFIPSRINLGVSAVTLEEEKEEIAKEQSSGNNVSDEAGRSKSRLLSIGGQRHKTQLMRLLDTVQDNNSNSSKTIIAHLKNKSASSVDLEIKSLCFGLEDEVGIDALRKVLKVFILETTIRRDFQVVQSYLNVVLKQHLDVIVNTKSLMIELIKLQRIQKESWGQLRGKIQTSLCLIEHMSGQIQ